MRRDHGVFHPIEPSSAAHVAFLVLLGDRGVVVEQRLGVLHHIGHRTRVHQGATVVGGGQSALKNGAGVEGKVIGCRRTTVPSGLPNVLIHAQGVSFDVGRKDRHRRVKDALGEVIQRQAQVNAGEVQVNALLGGNLERHARLGGVLRGQGGTRANDILVRETDFEAVADASAGLGEAIVVLAHDVTDEVQLLVKNTQSLAGHCGGGQNGVRHCRIPSKGRGVFRRC